ncbi:hypothetical protein KORDIASMS9_00576 [Kordia sp. SMS9]|uniref:hypothetical protein n=1 Tax=Kordia sp. SMS9 TaxID=2282170 RepID=UPI000E1078EF|nr:hypothetical protein [Kordia sp. SMS9]AXG68361.1 hypothetical protein KORDIASMS9_00576 [Kordia sp. SMS9]
MKKKNFKSLKLNKKSISQLHGNAINGGSSADYTTPMACSHDCTRHCSNHCETALSCPESEACPSSWIYICNACDTSEPQ